jgi:hypothetical protein
LELNRFFNNFADAPLFVFAQGSRFGYDHFIADPTRIGLVMSGKFNPPPDKFLVKWMFDKPFHSNHGGFIHLVADYGPDNLFLNSSLFHGANYYFIFKIIIELPSA